MNTNAKHYEELNIQPWEIMEKNFTTEEFVAYLKGNIIKYTLRNKGQDLSDAEKIKHYAEKLIEVIEKKETDEFLKEDAERIYGEPKFKVGDRVIVSDPALRNNRRATVVHLRDKDLLGYRYLVELDEAGAGWEATKIEHGINCPNAWSVYESKLELLSEEPSPALVPNVWYDAETFTVEELKELLPVGTRVLVTMEPDGNRMVNLPYERLLSTTVSNIGKNELKNSTRVGISADIWWRRYFKIEG